MCIRDSVALRVAVADMKKRAESATASVLSRRRHAKATKNQGHCGLGEAFRAFRAPWAPSVFPCPRRRGEVQPRPVRTSHGFCSGPLHSAGGGGSLQTARPKGNPRRFQAWRGLRSRRGLSGPLGAPAHALGGGQVA
eukprot:4857982-Alexandrium_andersonii.AAC.1